MKSSLILLELEKIRKPFDFEIELFIVLIWTMVQFYIFEYKIEIYKKLILDTIKGKYVNFSVKSWFNDNFKLDCLIWTHDTSVWSY